MNKYFVGLLLLGVSLLTPVSASAALVTVEPSGRYTYNVLSAESEIALLPLDKPEIEIKKAGFNDVTAKMAIALFKDADKVLLSIKDDEGTTKADVTGYKDTVIEISAKNDAESVLIGVTDGGFTITQDGVDATTAYEISVDPGKRAVYLSAPSGERILSLFPRDAIDALVKTNMITSSPESMALTETETGDLTYEVHATRDIAPFGLITYGVPRVIAVSAVNGKVLHIEDPLWFRVLSFLFV